MIGRPDASEAAAYYFTYIDLVPGEDPLRALEVQAEEASALLAGVSEDASRHCYAPGKWSLRQVLNHVTDTERVFVFRALWFACGFDAPLQSFEPDPAAAGAEADRIAWAAHLEEFGHVRRATLALFRHLPPDAWMRRGIASGTPVTVRALAYLVAGHAAHHLALLRERYLSFPSP